MKELKVRYSLKVPNAYEIYYEGGGELPDCLKGAYTSPGLAQAAIDLHLNKKPQPKRTLKKDESL